MNPKKAILNAEQNLYAKLSYLTEFTDKLNLISEPDYKMLLTPVLSPFMNVAFDFRFIPKQMGPGIQKITKTFVDHKRPFLMILGSATPQQELLGIFKDQRFEVFQSQPVLALDLEAAELKPVPSVGHVALVEDNQIKKKRLEFIKSVDESRGEMEEIVKDFAVGSRHALQRVAVTTKAGRVIMSGNVFYKDGHVGLYDVVEHPEDAHKEHFALLISEVARIYKEKGAHTMTALGLNFHREQALKKQGFQDVGTFDYYGLSHILSELG